MSQATKNIANMARSAFRAAVNAALQALETKNSGATEPAETWPYQEWADTASGWLKQRNAANDGWINVRKLADATTTAGEALRVAVDATAARAAIGARAEADDLVLAAGKVVIFEGTVDDAFETTVTAENPTADRSQTLPNMSGQIAVQARGANIASDSTINLTTATGDIVDVTGTTTINAITLADGLERQVRFTGALTLTNGASLVLPGGANITTAAGDVATFRGYASSVVRCTGYQRANGQPVVGGVGQSMVRLDGANGYGSTNTRIRRFTNVVTNAGSDLTYADSAANGASFTINTSGVYAISYCDSFAGGGPLGLSLNSSQLTTDITAITAANRLAMARIANNNYGMEVSWTGYLSAGDVVRAHTNAGAVGTDPVHFTIVRVA